MLILQRLAVGRDQFKVYEGQSYIGRLYKAPADDWFWSLDLLLMEGKTSVDGRAVTQVDAVTRLRAEWERLQRSRRQPAA